MKVTMALTLDGLVRTLRRALHDLADETDRAYDRNLPWPDSRRGEMPKAGRVTDDDRAGR